MRASLRHFLALFAIFCLITTATVSPDSVAAVTQMRSFFSGFGQLTGPLQLDVAIRPPIARPGAAIHVNLTLTNYSEQTAVPQLIIEVPAGLSLDRWLLPGGVSVNLQNNSLNWNPIIAANGGVTQLDLTFQVDVADIARPERVFTVTVRQGEWEQKLETAFWVGMPPQATITVSPARASVGQPIQLLANVIGPGPFGQIWYLGDGRVVDANDPVVVYPLAGSYQITLQVANPLAAAVVGKAIVIVPEPAAFFTPADVTAGVDRPVTFTNQSGGQPPLRYTWEFGDGAGASDVEPTHQYSAPGTYQVKLIVENDYGRAETAWPITIGLPPIADMMISESGKAGEPVFGQAFGDESVRHFRWDMGDGTILEGEQISHSYQNGGNYWVTMSAANQFDRTEISGWIAIEPGMSHLYLPLVVADQTGSAVEDPLAESQLAGVNLAGDDILAAGELLEISEPIVLTPLNLPRTLTPVEQLYQYINAARQLHNVPPVTPVYELTVAAQRHAEDMAINRFTGHIGSDGLTPPMRFILYGYRYGYAGEVTAWGVEKAIRAVEFWLNSPPHRQILLNYAISDVGLGYTVDYQSPNVWYWTAEFGSPSLPFIPIEIPAALLPEIVYDPITLLQPLPDSAFEPRRATFLFTWNWPGTLAAEQQFRVYLVGQNGLQPVGIVDQPVGGSEYQLQIMANQLTTAPGLEQWLVRLETSDGQTVLVESERRAIRLAGAAVPAPSTRP
jgi:uncharacterized protein YkwD/PKD repeat protein